VPNDDDNDKYLSLDKFHCSQQIKICIFMAFMVFMVFMPSLNRLKLQFS
jgi:hypothetical protein